MDSDPRVLFAPVSGPKGTGEYVRCRIVAEALQRARPDVAVRFVVNRHAPYAAGTPYPTSLIDDSPTRDVDGVIAVLERERPAVVVFDNAGRAKLLRRARELGAKIVYVSRRPGKRMHAFRPSWLRHLDQHWLAFPWIVDGPLTPLERWADKAIGNVEIIVLEAIFAESIEPERTAYLESIGVAGRPYVLVVPGGGGKQVRGKDTPAIFREAALRIAREHDITVVRIAGVNAPEDDRSVAGVRSFAHVSHRELVHLIHDAHLVVGNGGSMMTQVLAHEKVSVAVALAPDQPMRVRRLAERGALVASPLDADEIAERAGALLSDPDRFDRVAEGAAAAGITNGVGRAVAGLERLLETHG